MSMENSRFRFRAWYRDQMWDSNFTVDCSGEVYTINDDFMKDAKLMQWTGLQDKNGVEIYEGDIMKYPINDNTEFFTDVVEWCKSLPYSSDCGYEFYLESEEGFVAGNIHENGDLL